MQSVYCGEHGSSYPWVVPALSFHTYIRALSRLRHGIGQHVGVILLDSHFIEGAGHSENLGREYAKINALCSRVSQFGVIFPNHSASGRDLCASH